MEIVLNYNFGFTILKYACVLKFNIKHKTKLLELFYSSFQNLPLTLSGSVLVVQ